MSRLEDGAMNLANSAIMFVVNVIISNMETIPCESYDALYYFFFSKHNINEYKRYITYIVQRVEY